MKVLNGKDLEVDFIVDGEEKKVVEVLELKNCVTSYMHTYLDMFKEEMANAKDTLDYKVFGKYKVKETFAGEESLTELLTQYVERSVSMKY